MRVWLDRLQRGTLLLTAFVYSAGYATVGLVLMLATTTALGVASRRVAWRRTILDLPIVLFILVLLISAWRSPYRPIATASVGLAALTIYLGYGVLQSVGQRAAGLLDGFLLAWIAGGVITAVWGIAAYLATGGPASTPPLGHNAIGTTLVVALLLTFHLYARSVGLARTLSLLAAAVLAVGLEVTFTRGAWLGAAVGTLLLLALEPRQSWRPAVIVLAAVVLVGALARSQHALFLEKITTISSVQENRGRVAIARSAVEIFKAHPVTGTGLNTFSLEYPKYQFQEDISPTQPFAHNIFLNMAAEGGGLGLAAFLAVILTALAVGWRRHAHVRFPDAAARQAALLAAFVGILVHQQFDGTAISVHVGVGMWMLMSALVLPDLPGRPQDP